MAWNNDDYVQVNERIEAFYAKYPEGALQSEIVEFTESRVTVKAYAYRNAEDTHPAVGHSFLTIPGKTNFTRDAELENAETSAWGRALAALGFEVKRSVASRDEVQAKRSASEEQRTCPIHDTPMAKVPGKNVWAHRVAGLDGNPDVCTGKAA